MSARTAESVVRSVRQTVPTPCRSTLRITWSRRPESHWLSLVYETSASPAMLQRLPGASILDLHGTLRITNADPRYLGLWRRYGGSVVLPHRLARRSAASQAAAPLLAPRKQDGSGNESRTRIAEVMSLARKLSLPARYVSHGPRLYWRCHRDSNPKFLRLKGAVFVQLHWHRKLWDILSTRRIAPPA